MPDYRNVPTPWGKSSSGQRMAPGITLYHTPGHGGMKVVKRLNEQIPAAFRHVNGWYEEDCDAKIVFYFHHDAIKAYMTEHDMPGWSCSAEEYFSKFTKEYFRDNLTSSGYFIPECIHHFGTVYTPEQLDAYGRENLAKEMARIKRLEQRRMPKPGDIVRFDKELRFSNGAYYREFRFLQRSSFRTMQGGLVRISGWRAMDFVTIPSEAG